MVLDGMRLLELIKPEVSDSRLRDVIDFEVNYARRALEKEIEEKDAMLLKKEGALAEKDSALAEKDSALAKMGDALNSKDEEINNLKAKLEENGIDY